MGGSGLAPAALGGGAAAATPESAGVVVEVAGAGDATAVEGACFMAKAVTIPSSAATLTNAATIRPPAARWRFLLPRWPVGDAAGTADTDGPTDPAAAASPEPEADGGSAHRSSKLAAEVASGGATLDDLGGTPSGGTVGAGKGAGSSTSDGVGGRPVL